MHCELTDWNVFCRVLIELGAFVRYEAREDGDGTKTTDEHYDEYCDFAYECQVGGDIERESDGREC